MHTCKRHRGMLQVIFSSIYLSRALSLLVTALFNHIRNSFYFKLTVSILRFILSFFPMWSWFTFTKLSEAALWQTGNTFDQNAQYKVQSNSWTLNTIHEIFLLQEYWLYLEGKSNKKEKYIALNERKYYINVFIFVDMITKRLHFFVGLVFVNKSCR